MSQRTAQRMMQVAEVFSGKNDTVSLLTDSAMYLLSAPSTPEPAREQVIQEAQATGKSPTKARVQEVIAQHRPAANVVASASTGSRQQGAQLATCSVCHRPLSDPASAIAGVGPCCAAKRTTAAGSGTVDDEDEQPLQVADVDDILTPDRHDLSSAAQQRNERINSVLRRLYAARSAAHEFEELTGVYTHTPAFERVMDAMIGTLEANLV